METKNVGGAAVALIGAGLPGRAFPVRELIMSVVPKKTVERIQFYEDHTAPWAANAVAIGSTTTLVTDLTTKTTAARAAYDAQQAAQNVAKAATLTLENAMRALSQAGSDIIFQIRAKAGASGNSVYALAQIPAPATPSPVGAPGTPSDFAVELNQDGSIVLKWKCNNPAGSSGTIYQIFRRDSAEGEFNYVGGTGAKKFLDQTIPAGTSSVTYQMQAVRSTQAGAWAQFNVNFGVAGETTVTVQAPSKIAA